MVHINDARKDLHEAFIKGEINRRDFQTENLSSYLYGFK